MKRILAMLLATLMVLTLAACGAGNGNGNAGNANSGNEQSTGSGNEQSTGTGRDSITVATNMIISTIDPWDKSSLQNNQVRTQIYESFYYFNDNTGEYEPRLATSYDVSEDGKTYTFHLREDVKFHNGDPMTASDVVYSIGRALEEPSLASYTSAIDSYEAVDDSTVNITLKDVNAPFMMNATWIYIVSEKACEEAGDSLGNTAVLCGTGPYYVEEYNPDVQIVLKAFPDYYRGEAAIKTATFKPIVDNSTGLIAFENGELDYYNVPTTDWKEISESGKYNTELVAANHISYFGVNYRGVLEDVKVREAVAHCIDKAAIVLGAYDGLASQADCIVNSSYVIGAPTENITYDYNIERAKELLAEAGYADGVDIGVILTIAGGYFEKMALILQSSLAEAGITCTLESMEQASALAKMGKGDFDIMCAGYSGEYDYDFWKIMTHSSATETSYIKFALAPASAGIPSAEIDALYDAGAKELDTEKRSEIYKELDDKMMETCTYLPVFYKQIPYAWNKDLNATTHSNYYMIYEWSWN